MKDNSYLKNLIENMDENTSLKQLQNYVDEMVNIRGFSDETPQDCLLRNLTQRQFGGLAAQGCCKIHKSWSTDFLLPEAI